MFLLEVYNQDMLTLICLIAITAGIRLKNGKTFDYEDINKYKLTMHVTDTYATTGPYYLQVNVVNVPEVCGFDKVVYEASTTEAGVSNTTLLLFCYTFLHVLSEVYVYCCEYKYGTCLFNSNIL